MIILTFNSGMSPIVYESLVETKVGVKSDSAIKKVLCRSNQRYGRNPTSNRGMWVSNLHSFARGMGPKVIYSIKWKVEVIQEMEEFLMDVWKDIREVPNEVVEILLIGTGASNIAP